MRWFVRLLAAALMLGAAPAHASEIPAPVWKAYRDAIKVSSQPSRDPVVDNLVRITKSDPRVRWRTIKGHRHVLVATLRRDPVTNVTPGQAFELSSPRWVFIPRQLRNRCARVGCESMGPGRLDLTLKQFLGVPPDANYSVANTFWVRPRDMFRPCRQPSIRAASCTRRAPGPLPDINGVAIKAFLREQAAYAWRWPRRWNPATAVSCASAWPEPARCYGFPWTRLGYAYDWAPNRNRVGLSEFVVTAGARAYLQRIGSQQQLLTPRGSASR